MTPHPVYILEKNYKSYGGHLIHIFIWKCEPDGFIRFTIFFFKM